MKYNSIKDPIRVYSEILGGKWRLLILHQLFSNTQRFKDLSRTIEGITPRMLTKELRALEKYNLVEKDVYKEVPPRVEYSLTDEGVKLYPLVEQIIAVGEQMSHLLNEDISIENDVVLEPSLLLRVEEKTLPNVVEKIEEIRPIISTLNEEKEENKIPELVEEKQKSIPEEKEVKNTEEPEKEPLKTNELQLKVAKNEKGQEVVQLLLF